MIPADTAAAESSKIFEKINTVLPVDMLEWRDKMMISHALWRIKEELISLSISALRSI
jgi:hypothetical protein